ncbi:MAG TPA: hypothetical protein VFN92_06225 [Solirubrobacterales bacterium]|nr:hypothetical protein [Solirubrobacterales bacterium]
MGDHGRRRRRRRSADQGPAVRGRAPELADRPLDPGLHWVAAGTVFAIATAVAGAWVLLVEILR